MQEYEKQSQLYYVQNRDPADLSNPLNDLNNPKFSNWYKSCVQNLSIDPHVTLTGVQELSICMYIICTVYNQLS